LKIFLFYNINIFRCHQQITRQFFLQSPHPLAQLAQAVLSEDHVQQPVSAHQEGVVVIWSIQLLAHKTRFLQHTNRLLWLQTTIFMRSLKLPTMLSLALPIRQPLTIVCLTQMHKPQVLGTILQQILEPIQLLQIHPVLMATFATIKFSTVQIFTQLSSPQWQPQQAPQNLASPQVKSAHPPVNVQPIIAAATLWTQIQAISHSTTASSKQ